MSRQRSGWTGMEHRCRARAGVFATGCVLGVLAWVSAAPGSLLADTSAEDSPEALQAPARPGPASEPGTRGESDRSGKPGRRQRIRDEGAEDELQVRSRKLLAMEIRRAFLSA